MNQEMKTCQNCKNQFTIEPEDFLFYEKIKVPAPTWCPECRLQRKMTWRNERSIFKRKCDLCGKDTISVYHSSAPFPVYCPECFYGDKWDPLFFGIDYDFSRPFFTQFAELTKKAPHLASQRSNDLVNSDYSNHLASSKDCYLVFASTNDENCMYSGYTSYSRDIIDGLRIFKCEQCYFSTDCSNCKNVKFSEQTQDSMDCSFLYNCRNCSNCFLCTNLIHKSYCIRNVQYTKEDYKKAISQIDTGAIQILVSLKNEFESLKEKTIRRCVEGYNKINSSGSFLRNVKNCVNCFDLANSENCRYVFYGDNAVDTQDVYGAYPKTELCYESIGSGAPAYDCKFCYSPWGASGLEYCSIVILGTSNCFGCVQLVGKNYCILNKQYTKEKYKELTQKIRAHMMEMPYVDGKGRVFRYGEFFPAELSPFAYNETIAQEYFPLTKTQNVSWREIDPREYKISIGAENIPTHIKDVSDGITAEILQCAHKGGCSHLCATAFRILPRELEYYRKMNLPLPRLCPNCRHYERLAKRNPMKLWHRACMCDEPNHNHTGKCTNEFETSYAPERSEIVYCESCYQKEVL